MGSGLTITQQHYGLSAEYVLGMNEIGSRVYSEEIN